MNRFKSIFIICVFLIVSTWNVKAQVTINYVDMFQLGDRYIIATGNSSSVSPGAGGSNRTWNFSNLHSNSIDTEIVIAPSAAPYPNIFGAADVVLKTAASGYPVYAYYKQLQNEEIALGSSYPAGFDFFTPAYECYPLPLTYQNHWAGTVRYEKVSRDTVFQPGSDSVRDKYSLAYYDTVDAWGTLHTPAGIYNVIRNREIQSNGTDSIYTHSKSSNTWSFYGTTTPLFLQDSYCWYSPGTRVQVLSFTYTKSGFLIGNQWLKETLYTGLMNQKTKVYSLAFPNPATNELTVKLSSAEGQYLKVYDISGQLIETIAIADGNSKILTGGYANGLYFYQIVGKYQEILGSNKFSVLK